MRAFWIAGALCLAVGCAAGAEEEASRERAASERGLFARHPFFRFIGEAELDGIPVSVFRTVVVDIRPGETRAQIAWGYRRQIEPVPRIEIDSTEWLVTALCGERVLSYEQFEDGHENRIRRRGAAAHWTSDENRPVPDLLADRVMAEMCGGDAAAPVTVVAQGQRGSQPVEFSLPKRHEGVVPPPAASPPPPRPPRTSSGTGLVLGPLAIITNQHVVEGCTSVVLTSPGGEKISGSVVAVDSVVDLALVRPSLPASPALSLRQGAVEVGEPLVTFGFPLTGLLSSGGVATTGIVSALSGIGDDVSRIQITAPIQPGNSGGAVLDESAQVIGVVVSKLNAMRIAREIGDVTQNVNFALSLAALQKFLRTQQVPYSRASAAVPRSVKEIVSVARHASRMVVCSRPE